MTKKHFVAIAKIMAAENTAAHDPDNDPAQETITAAEQVERIVYRLADYFAGENPLFNKNKFLKACKVADKDYSFICGVCGFKYAKKPEVCGSCGNDAEIQRI